MTLVPLTALPGLGSRRLALIARLVLSRRNRAGLAAEPYEGVLGVGVERVAADRQQVPAPRLVK